MAILTINWASSYTAVMQNTFKKLSSKTVYYWYNNLSTQAISSPPVPHMPSWHEHGLYLHK
jgi:hypothetical protein